MRNLLSRFSRTTLIVAGVAAVAVFAFGIYWFGPQRLFTSATADEALPGARPSGSPGVTSTAGPSAAATDDPTSEPETGLVTVAEGAFRSLAHETTGTARIVTDPDGVTYLRIEDLDSLAGPDLRVYLSSESVDADDAAFGDDSLVADLGALRANKGNLTYEIGADVDLDAVKTVAIWCRRFTVGFGVAGLEAVG
ncbi:MAG: DM13 domain-containing protein [Actinomycetota bacterium]